MKILIQIFLPREKNEESACRKGTFDRFLFQFFEVRPSLSRSCSVRSKSRSCRAADV